jgi:SulP family sulfate permease
VSRKIPGPLVALGLAGIVAALLARFVPGFEVATIHSRFADGIPQLPPLPVLPWHLPGADGQPLDLSFGLIRELIPSAFAIAMLGAIESLLSAVVADGMTSGSHDPDAELLAQGAGNLIAPFFGGIAATGALARTATNIRAGAQSPLAAIFHSAFVLLSLLLLAPVLNFLPMASLAALLLVVAWNMSDSKHFLHILKAAPRSDVVVLLVCFALTVIFDMVVSVSVGVVLASLLFLRRMADVSTVRVAEPLPHAAQPLPKGVLVYEVAGPLFFGAVQKAMSAIQRVPAGIRAVVLDLSAVPAIDASGLVGLESAVARLHGLGIAVVLGGVQGQPLRALARSGLRDGGSGRLSIHRTMAKAREAATREAEGEPPDTFSP